MNNQEKFVKLDSLKLYDSLIKKEIDKRIAEGTLNLSSVARSGSYNDLVDKPTVPTPAQSISASDIGYASGSQVYSYVSNAVSGLSGAMHFIDVVSEEDFDTIIAATKEVGDVYIVNLTEDNTAIFDGNIVESGDLLVWTKDNTWSIVQANIDLEALKTAISLEIDTKIANKVDQNDFLQNVAANGIVLPEVQSKWFAWTGDAICEFTEHKPNKEREDSYGLYNYIDVEGGAVAPIDRLFPWISNIPVNAEWIIKINNTSYTRTVSTIILNSTLCPLVEEETTGYYVGNLKKIEAIDSSVQVESEDTFGVCLVKVNNSLYCMLGYDDRFPGGVEDSITTISVAYSPAFIKNHLSLFDLSKHFNAVDSDIYEKLSEAENVNNKVTTLSAQSTNDQYPSAKVVYDNLITKADASSLAAVATTGSYNDLSDTPVIDVWSTNFTVITWSGDGSTENPYATTLKFKLYKNNEVYTDTIYFRFTKQSLQNQASTNLNYGPITPSNTNIYSQNLGENISNCDFISVTGTVYEDSEYTKPVLSIHCSSYAKAEGIVANNSRGYTTGGQVYQYINAQNFVSSTALATVATTGSYNDLSDTPAIGSVTSNEINGLFNS